MLAVAREGLRALCASSSLAGGNQLLLSACSLRLVHFAADASMQQQQQRQRPRSRDPDVLARAAATGAPATLPELASRPLPYPVLCLSSINDPDNYGLGVSTQGSGEPEYYWQQLHSMSNPKEAVTQSGKCCTGQPSTLCPQGFLTAQTRPTVQHVIFRSSMLDPDVFE